MFEYIDSCHKAFGLWDMKLSSTELYKPEYKLSKFSREQFTDEYHVSIHHVHCVEW